VRSFIAETWKFIAGQQEHPVYRHEVRGWSYARFWRGMRQGCLPLVLLVVLGCACACGGTTLLGTSFPPNIPEDVLVAVTTTLIGLLVGAEIVRWLTGLLATVLAATTVSAEVEAATLDVLRLTPVPAREIVLAKFGAAFRQFRLPLLAVAVVRAVAIVGFLILLVAVILTDESIGASGAVPPIAPPGGEVVGIAIAGAGVVFALVVLLAYTLVEPALSAFMFSAIGMLASSLSRTRASSLTLAAGIRVGLWAVSYVAGQVVSGMLSLLALPLTALPATPLWFAPLSAAGPATLVFGGAVATVLWVLLIAAAQIGVGLAALAASVRRVERLSYL